MDGFVSTTHDGAETPGWVTPRDIDPEESYFDRSLLSVPHFPLHPTGPSTGDRPPTRDFEERTAGDVGLEDRTRYVGGERTDRTLVHEPTTYPDVLPRVVKSRLKSLSSSVN